ncbi:MAG: hypothetical protein ACQKBV_14100 [Puniceicoccales bacterium]
MKKAANHLLYVAWAFIFIGALALIQTVQAFLMSPTPVPNFLMVFLVVGYGLLRRKNMARVFAVSCAYVMIIIYAGNLFFVFSGRLPLPPMTMFDTIAFWVIRILAITASGYALWALQLRRVREQFNER